MLVRVLILLCSVITASSIGIAGEISCLHPHGTTNPVQSPPPAQTGSLAIPGITTTEPCFEVAINGIIERGDAERLESFLAREPTVSTVYLFSSGGNLFEGMKVGRLIRAHFLHVSAKPLSRFDGKRLGPACGEAGQPVCCASACALAYFGGIAWRRDEFVGLHRPTLRDLGDRSYAEAQQALKEAASKIKDYLIEMEIEDRLYSLMMSAAPERIAVAAVGPTHPDDGSYKHPPSVQDWLQAKCRHKIKRPDHEMERCADERARRRHAANKWSASIDEQVKSISLPDLDRRVRDLSGRVIAGERLALEDYAFLDAGRKRLEQVRLSEQKDSIDKMSISQLRMYAREHRGHDIVKERVYKRIEELTGDTLIGDPSVDCGWAQNTDSILSNCTIVIDRGDLETLRSRAVAHQRRGDVYFTMRDHDRTIADYTKALDLRVRLSASADAGLFNKAEGSMHLT